MGEGPLRTREISRQNGALGREKGQGYGQCRWDHCGAKATAFKLSQGHIEFDLGVTSEDWLVKGKLVKSRARKEVRELRQDLGCRELERRKISSCPRKKERRPFENYK